NPAPSGFVFFFFDLAVPPRVLPSFPTRRSSDLGAACFWSLAARQPDLDGRAWSVCRPTANRNWSGPAKIAAGATHGPGGPIPIRSEEHTSELQSRGHLVCRLLLEKKNAIHRRTV